MIENIDINEIMGRLAERIKASVSPYHTTEYALNELKEVLTNKSYVVIIDFAM